MTTTAIKKRTTVIPNQVLGMLIFVVTEIMFFVALMSAYLVIKKEGINWAPPENVKLPLLTTAFNTFVLFASGLMFILAERSFRKNNKDKTLSYLTYSALFGLFFVAIQGYEWLQLIKYGMTMKSDIFGATFFLLIGGHGLHALIGALALFYGYHKVKKDEFELPALRALGIFWFLIVGVWPFLYGLVYF